MLQPDKKTNVTLRYDTRASDTNLTARQKSLSRNRIWLGPCGVTLVTITFSTVWLQHSAAASSALFVTWVTINLRELNAMTMLLRIGLPGEKKNKKKPDECASSPAAWLDILQPGVKSTRFLRSALVCWRAVLERWPVQNDCKSLVHPSPADGVSMTFHTAA